MQAAAHKDELQVVVRARDLASYVFAATAGSPKKFRSTFVYRLQNLSLDVVEHIWRANAIRVEGPDGVPSPDRLERRVGFQREALVSLRLLCYLAQIAREQGCLLMRQLKCISEQADEVSRLLVSWSSSDRRRYGG